MSISAPPASKAHDAVPLVVDLDGTLVTTDLLYEAVGQLAATKPLKLLHMASWLFGGKARMKAHLAAYAAMMPDSLPYNPDMLSLLKQARAEGRKLYLATAADQAQAKVVADHLGLFDGVFASDGTTNLEGEAKAETLCRAFGSGGFDYAGNSTADFAVWAHARRVIAVVKDGSSMARRLSASHPDCLCIQVGPSDLRGYLALIRPHQWSKNLLLLLPMIAGHAVSLENGLSLFLAFVSFCLSASAVYTANDIVDITRDRQHPRKRLRPLATGQVPVLHAMAMVPILAILALLPALALPAGFLFALIGYLAATSAYSLWLKRHAVADVMTLAGLYSLRVFTGAVAISIPLSPWMLAFSMFIFLALALVKRHTELKDRTSAGTGQVPGRGYGQDDLPLLLVMSTASFYASVIVMTLYISSDAVLTLYQKPHGLWLVCAVLLYWVNRVLLLTHRGQMHDDPVIFALKDRVTWLCGALCAAALVWSSLP